MKKAHTNRNVEFEDLPLFLGSRHREVWENLPLPIQEKAARLLGELLLAHARPETKGGAEHE